MAELEFQERAHFRRRTDAPPPQGRAPPNKPDDIEEEIRLYRRNTRYRRQTVLVSVVLKEY